MPDKWPLSRQRSWWWLLCPGGVLVALFTVVDIDLGAQREPACMHMHPLDVAALAFVAVVLIVVIAILYAAADDKRCKNVRKLISTWKGNKPRKKEPKDKRKPGD
jgi:hypothetical protein